MICSQNYLNFELHNLQKYLNIFKFYFDFKYLNILQANFKLKIILIILN